MLGPFLSYLRFLRKSINVGNLVLPYYSIVYVYSISVIYIRKQHFRIFIRIRYSEILYKIQVKFTIAYPDENPKMLFSNVNH
jgi:hypothetical protein